MQSRRCDNDAECAGVNAGPCLSSIDRCQLALGILCDSDADCASVDVGPCNPSTCSSDGIAGAPSSPNTCDDWLCSDAGGGEGECTTGPDYGFCDGVLRANGDGVILCGIDDDCSPGVIGVDGGSCSLVERQECFLDSIVATGAAHTEFPRTAATFCLPPTGSSGVNSITGLPGPARMISQRSTNSYCASNPLIPYAPGSGCP